MNSWPKNSVRSLVKKSLIGKVWNLAGTHLGCEARSSYDVSGQQRGYREFLAGDDFIQLLLHFDRE